MTRGVIFDMDGVLVLTEEAHWRSWQCVGDVRGVTITHEAFLSCFGRVNPDCIPILFGPDTPAEEHGPIADAKERAFRDIIRADLPLADGVVPLLESLADAGAAIAVGSSAPPENVDLVLDGGGLRKYFSAIVDSSQVTRGKPAPDVFLRAAERLGLEPSACVVVEDAPAGIVAARAAGMRAVAVATTNASDDLVAAGAHAVYPCIAALPASALLGATDLNAEVAGPVT